MSGSELLPCPFCGGEARLEMSTNIFGERTYRVYCTGGICGARIGLRDSREDAVNAWNLRVPICPPLEDSIPDEED